MIESLARIQLVDEAKGVSWPGAGFDLVVALPEVSPEAVEAQRVKLRKEIEQLDKVIASHESQLGNETFVAKVPEKVLNGMREKLAAYRTQREKARETVAPGG